MRAKGPEDGREMRGADDGERGVTRSVILLGRVYSRARQGKCAQSRKQIEQKESHLPPLPSSRYRVSVYSALIRVRPRQVHRCVRERAVTSFYREIKGISRHDNLPRSLYVCLAYQARRRLLRACIKLRFSSDVVTLLQSASSGLQAR